MNTKINYYIVGIADNLRDMSFISNVLVIAKDEDELNEKINDVCASWYSEDEPVDADEDGVYEQSNGIWTSCEGYKEILESTYNDLRHFLAVV